MKVYKLTNSEGQTKNQTQWGENVTHEVSGQGELCTSGWLHCYPHPLIAVLMDSADACFTFGKQARLWEAEGSGEQKDDHGLKMGFSRLTTIREIPMPAMTIRQRLIIAIRVILISSSYDDPFVKLFGEWADKWIKGEIENKLVHKDYRARVLALPTSAFGSGRIFDLVNSVVHYWLCEDEVAAIIRYHIVSTHILNKHVNLLEIIEQVMHESV